MEIINRSPESTASPEEFRERLILFRGEVFEFFDDLASQYSPLRGIERFSSAINEFDERLFYMATGIKEDIGGTVIAHLINEVDVRQDVILNHFHNPDTVKDEDSLERMIPRATNFIRASMVGNQALTDGAKAELKRLDDLHRGE